VRSEQLRAFVPHLTSQSSQKVQPLCFMSGLFHLSFSLNTSKHQLLTMSPLPIFLKLNIAPSSPILASEMVIIERGNKGLT
jgi:hypothetical protein